ncbi:glycosyltransferase family 9 protein [Paradesertivirga mongoliensis]|uniref:Glycosyltransferase family 9 protein n=1 Tax=Paradesertivirga mongoliensis TaxID=2100740 RepID=A0ABW4ZKP5_9SPHI|nr:glycosyltransferase family 9 protein [Pedobacter mongoliensis]
MKILIIRFSSIGDIVLTTPVIRCLKQQIDGAEIHYLTKKSFASILDSNPYVDKLHLLSGTLSTTIKELEAENFDYIIDLHNNLRTRLIKLQLDVKARSFDKLNLKKFLLVNFKVNILPVKHIVDRYLDTVAFLDVKNDGQGLDYFFSGQHELESLLPDTHQKYIGLVIGAQHATKRLPVHKLIEICKTLSQPVVLLGGKEDAARGEEIRQGSPHNVFNGCGKYSLEQSAVLVKNAQQIISHDTGLMHIAAAFDKPIISVWGNTVPEFGMYPYKVSRHQMLEVKGLKCRPCSKIGYEKCPLGHFKCMNEQRTDSITIIDRSDN